MKKIRILILEDNPDDAKLMERELQKAKIEFSSQRADTKKGYLKSLSELKPDIILADYCLPSFDGLEALKIAQKKCPDVPFIFVSGIMEEDYAIETLKIGATDYVLKRRLSRLGPSVRRALSEFEERIARNQAEEELKSSEERLKILFEFAPDAYYLNDLKGTFVDGNRMAEELTGYAREGLIGKSFLKLKLLPPHQIPKAAALLAKNALGKGTGPDEFTLRRKDGSQVEVEIRTYPVKIKNKTLVLGIARDITERKRAEEELRQSYKKIQKFLVGSVHSILKTVEMRDPYTSGHQRRVTNLACAIAQEMGLPKDQIDGIRMAGIVHDIGKIYTPAEILTKPGPLTEAELSIIRTHPQIGYEILNEIEFPWPVAEIVLQHHERMLGDGYPAGLKGEQILLEARILAVADVVEAMSSHRPFRPALGLERALEEISRYRGFHYDPRVVDACLKLFDEKLSWIKDEMEKPVFP